MKIDSRWSKYQYKKNYKSAVFRGSGYPFKACLKARNRKSKIKSKAKQKRKIFTVCNKHNV